MPNTNLIMNALELAASRCEDLSPLVYPRFFQLCPAAEEHFETVGEAEMGAMMNELLETVMELAAGSEHVQQSIRSDVTTHDDWSIERDMYAPLLTALLEIMRELLANDWSQAMEASWAEHLDQVLSIIQKQTFTCPHNH